MLWLVPSPWSESTSSTSLVAFSQAIRLIIHVPDRCPKHGCHVIWLFVQIMSIKYSNKLSKLITVSTLFRVESKYRWGVYKFISHNSVTNTVYCMGSINYRYIFIHWYCLWHILVKGDWVTIALYEILLCIHCNLLFNTFNISRATNV